MDRLCRGISTCCWETAHLLHRGEEPPTPHPCSPSSPFSLVNCSCCLFWDEAGRQGDWRRGKGEQKLSSTQTSKPGFHGGVAVGSSTPHISLRSPQCGHVPFGEGSWIILNQPLYTKPLLTNFPSKRHVTQYRPEFISGTF